MPLTKALIKNSIFSVLGYTLITAFILGLMLLLFNVIWILAISVLPFLILFYIILGKYLTDLRNWKLNLLSVSFLSLVLLIFWIIYYSADPRANMLTEAYCNYMASYYAVNPVSKCFLLIFNLFMIENKLVADILGLLSNVVPSLLIWTGLEIKRRKKNKKVIKNVDDVT